MSLAGCTLPASPLVGQPGGRYLERVVDSKISTHQENTGMAKGSGGWRISQRMKSATILCCWLMFMSPPNGC